MSQLSENPVLLREVRNRMRWRRIPFKTILRVGGVIGIFSVLGYGRLITLINQARPDDASSLWWILSFGLLALIALLAPTLSATAISQEREQQTWEGLVVTRLTPMQILLGKWLARQVLLAVTLGVLAPLLIAVAIHGKIPLLTALLSFLTLAATSAFYSALGMFCSDVARRTPAAIAVSLLTVLMFCLGSVVINEVFISMMAGPSFDYSYYREVNPVLWCNPFFILSAVQQLFDAPRDPASAVDAMRPLMISSYLILTIALTAFLFYVMIGRYRKSSRDR